jgi:hypothetical protein
MVNTKKQKLIERYGADMRLPDLREEIGKCRRHGQMHDACMVRYVDLVPSQRGDPCHVAALGCAAQVLRRFLHSGILARGDEKKMARNGV